MCSFGALAVRPAVFAIRGMPEWKVFKLTYVLYQEGDPLGKLMSIATLSPMLVAFGLGAAFVVTRQLPWAWSLLGVLLTDGFCIVLKELLNQPRPEGSYREGPGMPSEHAAFCAFLVAHLSLWVCLRARCLLLLKALAVILMAAWALLVAYSRHHLGAVLVSICCNFSCYQDPFDFAAPQTMFHSAVQIIAGLVLGCSGGCVWFVAERWPPTASFLEWAQRGLDSIWKSLGISFECYHREHTD
eukprot:s3657_g10.t1